VAGFRISGVEHSSSAIREVDVPQLRRLVAYFPQRRPRFDLSLGHVAFVIDEVSLGKILFEHFGFPYHLSFHRLLNTHL
jgi:hypothetical protein